MDDMTDCGCCAGIALETPAAKINRAGLPAIAYRVGTHASFKASAARAPVQPPSIRHSPVSRRASDDDYTHRAVRQLRGRWPTC